MLKHIKNRVKTKIRKESLSSEVSKNLPRQRQVVSKIPDDLTPFPSDAKVPLFWYRSSIRHSDDCRVYNSCFLMQPIGSNVIGTFVPYIVFYVNRMELVLDFVSPMFFVEDDVETYPFQIGLQK